jgi:hypothetical protein
MPDWRNPRLPSPPVGQRYPDPGRAAGGKLDDTPRERDLEEDDLTSQAAAVASDLQEILDAGSLTIIQAAAVRNAIELLGQLSGADVSQESNRSRTTAGTLLEGKRRGALSRGEREAREWARRLLR